MTIKLVVGLGNFGICYKNSRHNFGAEYVQLLAKKYKIILHKNKELYGYLGKLRLHNVIVRLLIPDSYINESGLSVSACVTQYQLSPTEILVVHDDLDLLPGEIRIKLGNRSNDSHRGLLDIVTQLKDKSNFYRLRIGIGRPDNKNKIIDFVLSQPSIHEKSAINNIIDIAIQYIENIVNKDFIKVMNKLHAYRSNFIRN